MNHGQVSLGGRTFRARWGIRSHLRKGHDRALCADGFAAVADGATPLAPDWPDAGAFAETALAALHSATRDPGRSPTKIWATAISATATRSGAREPSVSCSVAAVWEAGTAIELSVLGDCTISVDTEAGRLRLHDASVPRLDESAALAPVADRAAAVLRNRTLMNKLDGYWIFATDPAAAAHIQHLRLDAARIRSILLHTDGLQPEAVPGRAHQDIVSAWETTPTFADDATFLLLEPGSD